MHRYTLRQLRVNFRKDFLFVLPRLIRHDALSALLCFFLFALKLLLLCVDQFHVLLQLCYTFRILPVCWADSVERVMWEHRLLSYFRLLKVLLPLNLLLKLLQLLDVVVMARWALSTRLVFDWKSVLRVLGSWRLEVPFLKLLWPLWVPKERNYIHIVVVVSRWFLAHLVGLLMDYFQGGRVMGLTGQLV